ncbi:MAG: lipoate--protein ligase family protein [Asgard group archaeon]|nr:lipoate--protein ligase family protein [Asgard group archaeon]
MKTASLRTKKGIIEIELILKDDIISYVKITGDFFIYPEEALEKIENTLVGSSTKKPELLKKLTKVYQENKISTPGITLDDWLKVITIALTS